MSPEDRKREGRARGWASCQERKHRRAAALRPLLERGVGVKRAASTLGISERQASRLRSEFRIPDPWARRSSGELGR